MTNVVARLVVRRDTSHTWVLETKHSRHKLSEFHCESAEEAYTLGKNFMTSFSMSSTLEVEDGSKHEYITPQASVP